MISEEQRKNDKTLSKCVMTQEICKSKNKRKSHYILCLLPFLSRIPLPREPSKHTEHIILQGLKIYGIQPTEK